MLRLLQIASNAESNCRNYAVCVCVKEQTRTQNTHTKCVVTVPGADNNFRFSFSFFAAVAAPLLWLARNALISALIYMAHNTGVHNQSQSSCVFGTRKQRQHHKRGAEAPRSTGSQPNDAAAAATAAATAMIACAIANIVPVFCCC